MFCFETVLVLYVWDVLSEKDKMVFSRHLTIGDNKEMGLYEVPSFGSLFDFSIGMILASFQGAGILFCMIAWL